MLDPTDLSSVIHAHVRRYRASSSSQLAVDLEAACRRGTVATLSFVNRLESRARFSDAMWRWAETRSVAIAATVWRRAMHARILQALLLATVSRGAAEAGGVASERSRASIKASTTRTKSPAYGHRDRMDR